jgi:hypothetical protein
MEMVCTTHKGHPDTVKKYYIYDETTRGNTQINDENEVSRNRIFNVVVHHDS